MRMKTLSILALMLFLSSAAWAQSQTDARKVKRITFDREQVNIEYADGSKDIDVSEASVKRESDEEATAIAATKASQSQAKRQWLKADGRVLRQEPQQKGVYLVRENNGVKKIIKK